MRSSAKTVAAYLKSLPAERRKVVAAVRAVMTRHLPKGYQEAMNWGVVSYEVPLKTFPATHNGKPLMYAGLAAQKNGYAIYLMCAYADTSKMAFLREEFRKIGKRLDMGMSCLRFRKLEDVPLAAIGKVVASVSVKQYVALYEKARRKS